GLVHGLWCGFAIAYFTDPVPVVTSWARHLHPGGWIALVEIDDLFAHEPVSDRTRSLFTTYAEDALIAGRYDFHRSRKLRSVLEHCGFTIVNEGVLADLEFSFSGPARDDVLDGWKSRLEQMKLLRVQFGSEYEAARADFLSSLSNPAHQSSARVHYCVGQL